MKKLGYVFAALGALVIAAPTLASAETVVIKRGHHHYGPYGARAEFREHRDHGWHRGRGGISTTVTANYERKKNEDGRQK